MGHGSSNNIRTPHCEIRIHVLCPEQLVTATAPLGPAELSAEENERTVLPMRKFAEDVVSRVGVLIDLKQNKKVQALRQRL